MKKEYQKPEVEMISLIAKEEIANGEEDGGVITDPDVESSIF